MVDTRIFRTFTSPKEKKSYEVRELNKLTKLIKILSISVKQVFNTKSKLHKVWSKIILDLWKKRGPKFAIGYSKESRLLILRFINQSVDEYNPSYVKCSTDKLPKWFKPFKKLLNTTEGKRYVLTCLSLTRSLHLPLDPDWESISKSDDIIDNITDEEINWALKKLGCSKMNPKFKDYHLSSKKGPIGQALKSSGWELFNLPANLVKSIEILGGKMISQELDSLLSAPFGVPFLAIFDETYKDKEFRFRKLSVLEDMEGKTRIVGMFDYWSQTVLKPLHDSLNGALKRNKNDCTFNQSNFRSNLPTTGPYFSIDLKSATDRFPISFQKRVLTQLTSKEYAEAWSDVMVGYDFVRPDGSLIKYNKGQPMGAYSSFPMFSLCHHIIVRIAGKRVELPNYRDYSLLGDDIVLTNHKVVNKYEELIRNFKIDIVPSKSYKGNLIEFAKRHIYNDEEISGLQIGGFLKTWKSYPLLHGFFETSSERGYFKTCKTRESMLEELYTINNKRYLVSSIIKKYRVLYIYSSLFNRGTCGFLQNVPWIKDIYKVDEGENNLQILTSQINVIVGNVSKSFIDRTEKCHNKIYKQYYDLVHHFYQCEDPADKKILDVLIVKLPQLRVLRSIVDPMIIQMWTFRNLDHSQWFSVHRDMIITKISERMFFSEHIFSMSTADKKSYARTILAHKMHEYLWDQKTEITLKMIEDSIDNPKGHETLC